MLVHSNTLPLAKLSKRALCLDYHLKGRCSSSCNFDHEKCDKETVSELFEWCKSSSSTHNEEINQNYLRGLQFHYASSMIDVIDFALTSQKATNQLRKIK